MKVTQTNGNAANGIRGSRLRFWNSKGELIEEFTVPHRDAKWYCGRYPGGQYGQRWNEAVDKVNESEANNGN